MSESTSRWMRVFGTSLVTNLALYEFGVDSFWWRLLIAVMASVSVELIVEAAKTIKELMDEEEKKDDEKDKENDPAKRDPVGVTAPAAKTDLMTFTELERTFRDWQRINPEIATELSVILNQFEVCEQRAGVYATLVRSNPQKFRERCPDAPALFHDILDGICQNFNDMYNILVLAGAGMGVATPEKIDRELMESELNSNLKKFEYLERLSAWVVRRVSQLDNTVKDLDHEHTLDGMEAQAERDWKRTRGEGLVADGRSPLMEELDALRNGQMPGGQVARGR